MARWPLARRLLGFASLPFAGAIAPVVLLPLVSRASGPGGWAGIATAQAVGTLAATIIMFGWSVSGQSEVALAPTERDAAAVYRRSLRSRLLLAAVVVPTGALAFLVGSGSYGVVNSLMYVASAVTGLSFGWYCVGRARPGWVAAYEVLPKVLAMVVAAVVLLVTGLVWVYPAALLAATVGGALLFQRRCVPAQDGSRWDLGTAWRDSTSRWRAGALSIAGGIYASAPLPLAAVLASVDEVATLASGDKLYRYGLFGVIGLANGLQAWVLSGEGARRTARRQSSAVSAHAVLGGVGLAFLVLVGERASAIIFGQSVAAGTAVVVACGVAYAAVSMSTPLVRNTLIPGGRPGVVLATTTVTGVLGVGVMWTLGLHLGAAGIAWGFAASEVLNLALLASAVLVIGRRQRARATRGAGQR
ncbi:hypothetical protein CAE01nite_22470 [Cellulomonas aerilata]|uniref:Polysaccharide biosynthesis protein n=1 Tax=Cellulomonas aerilata TaxID=515326 RepID=A0A512DDH4_9CELL|nr:hypothetical protein CAE01nite_22470 [Cellulomonas aerilata]